MRNAYQPTKLLPIIQITARMIKADPTLTDDHDLGRLRFMLKEAIPVLADKSVCPNCGASMKASRIKVNGLVVELVQGMGRIVKERLAKGVPFTEANKIHVNVEESIHHNARNNTGNASDLGLIAQVDDKDAHWAITRRGWAGLRGEPVPAYVDMFRRAIVGRTEETTTFMQAVARSRSKREIGYDRREWFEFGENQQGKLL